MPSTLWLPRSVDNIIAECMYGVIQSVLLVPICISFATIIYRDPFFSAHLPMLIKLVTASCMAHQCVFSLFSTLPFAVGQVQDAGLIFLSAMASSIVAHCSKKGADDATIISTVLVTLSLATFLLGCLLVLIARMKLASLVQYLPMPVIGGYLAYIGFFCGQAGLALMASVEIVQIEDWALLMNAKAGLHVLPGLVMAASLYVAVRAVKSKLTMPAFLVGVVAAFYLLLFLSGSTLDDVRAAGWVAERQKLGPCWEGWDYLDLAKVDWKVVPTQIVSWLAMVVVVAFSSSLDVAAIEMEIGRPLDYDHELRTVGMSNAISGALGGYTGSYIFSQTIFNLRAKVESRLTGFVIIFFEALVFLLPVSPMAYIPKCFFGSLLLLIAMELCMEWLLGARHKMMLPEYVVNLLTFVACLLTGVEKGIVLGCAFAMAAFIFSYARIPAITALPVNGRSTVMRTFEERVLLRVMSNRVLMLSMRGYIFFGSSVRLLEDAKTALRLEQEAGPNPQLPPSYSPLKQKRRSRQDFQAQNQKGRSTRGRSRSNPGNDGRGAYGALPSQNAKAKGAGGGSGGGGGGGGGGFATRAPVSTFEAAVGGTGGEIPRSLSGGTGATEMTPIVTTLNGKSGLGQGKPASRALNFGNAAETSANGKKKYLVNFDENTGGGGDAYDDPEEPHYDNGDDEMYGGELQMAILDFTEATGLDASAARSCFLMLKQLLKQNAIRCVFVVSSPDIRALLEAHQVIDAPRGPPQHIPEQGDGAREWLSDEPIFESLDDALEWCEEQLLYEISSSTAKLAASSSSSSSSSPSRKQQPQRQQPSYPKPPLSKLLNPELVAAMGGRASGKNKSGGMDDSSSGGRPSSPVLDPLSRHPSYYSLIQQSRISPSAAASRGNGNGDDGSAASPVMALVSILEDYLQISPQDSPLRTDSSRAALAAHFERQSLRPGHVLLEAGKASDRLFLIERGTVDLVIDLQQSDRKSGTQPATSSPVIVYDGGGSPPRNASAASRAAAAAAAKGEAAILNHAGGASPRLQRISGGGICGELGFFLEAPQSFSAVAVRPTTAWILSRRQFAAMQVADAQLCILVQMALVKSLALSASQNLEGTRHRQLSQNNKKRA